MAKSAKELWMKEAFPPETRGDLHRALGIPIGQKIPLARLQTAANAGGRTGRMARAALNARPFAGKGGRSRKRRRSR